MARRAARLCALLASTLLCVALGTIVVRKIDQLGAVQVDGSQPVPAGAPQAPPPQREFNPATREAFAAILDRPIFARSRRPPEETAPQVEAPPPALDVDLAGVVIWQSERFALLRQKSEAGLKQVGVGGKAWGWNVVTIESDRVLLQNGGSERELRLKYKEPERSD